MQATFSDRFPESQESSATSVQSLRSTKERFAMKRILTASAAAAALALASVATPQYAEAHDGGAVAAGIIGGLAAGALIGAAVSQPHYYYRPPYYYAPGPVYYPRHCWWRHVRYWNGWRWRWHPVRVCD